jgi:hypothetical protein
LSVVSPDSPMYRLVDHWMRAYRRITRPTSGSGSAVDLPSLRVASEVDPQLLP